MNTKKELSKKQTAILIIMVALLTFFIELIVSGPTMASLPWESYAVRSMTTIILFFAIFVTSLLTAIGFFTSLNNASVWRLAIAMFFIIILMIAFSVISYYSVPAVKARFSYLSYIYFDKCDNPEDASASISEALNSDPQNYLYWMESGSTYAKEEDYAKSIFYFNKALELNQNSDELLLLRGRAYRENNDLDHAKQDLETAVEHCPQNAEYNYELGRVYYSYGQKSDRQGKDNFERALDCFTKAIKLSPKNKDYYYWRANTYLWLETRQDNLKAIDDLTTALSFQVDNAKYYYWRGRAYTYLKEYSQLKNAISDFTEAISIDSTNADYYWWRGQAYFESEQYQDSIEDFDRAIQHESGSASYYYWKAKAYGKLGDSASEKKSIQKAIDSNSSDPSYHYYLGALYFNEHDYDNAIAEFAACVDNAPDGAGYYFELGDAYYMNKQYWDAIEAYTKAIELDNTNSLYWARRGLCYSLVDDIDSMKADMISSMRAMDHGKEIVVD